MSQEQSGKQCRTKTKGFYARQIAELKNQDPQFKRCKKKQIKKDNKSTCKQARERKKFYIQTLQAQRDQLMTDNQLLKQQVSTLKQHLEQSKLSSIRTEVDQKAKLLAGQFRELMISLKNQDKMSISRSLSVLRDKFGISGRERKKWIEESLLRTIQLSMPLHFRVLTQNVDDRKLILTQHTNFSNYLEGAKKCVITDSISMKNKKKSLKNETQHQKGSIKFQQNIFKNSFSMD